MYECTQAVYKGEIWTAAQLKKEDGDYHQDLRLTMKKESQDHAFYCPECGENLILCAGNIREPYFRHYDGSECMLAEVDRAERYYAMLTCMEDIAKRSFPYAKLTHYGAVGERMRSQLLVETQDATYALNYVSNSVNLKWLEQKLERLNECGVVPVWFTIQKDNMKHIPTTVEYAVSRYQPVLKSIIPKQGMVVLKEYDKTGNRLLLSETYYQKDMYLGENGEFICDFDKREKRIHLKEQEQERNGKRVADFFFSKLSSLSSDGEGAVLHIEESAADVPQNAVYMNSMEEFWVPLRLLGEPELRKKATAVRNDFLFYIDQQIDRDNRESSRELITKVFCILKQKRQSTEWINATKHYKIGELDGDTE